MGCLSMTGITSGTKTYEIEIIAERSKNVVYPVESK